MIDRLTGVEVFVAVVQAGSFSLAAERLSLTRSAVGKAVARLEARLGVRLFHRTTRSQSLTEDGQSYYERCLRALAELESGEAALTSGRQEPAGRVRITMPILFGRRCVAPILFDLARAYPGLAFEMVFTDRPLDLHDEGFDLAVRNGGLPDNTGLVARLLGRQRTMVCASPAYLERCGTPRSLEDLAGHETLTYWRRGRVLNWLFDDLRTPREVAVNSRLRLDDLDAIADAAAAGMGLAWLPCWLIADRVRSGELVRVLAEVPSVSFDNWALWPQTPHLPSRTRAVIDALVERVPPLLNP